MGKFPKVEFQPYMPLFWPKLLADTLHLSHDEGWAYMLLLGHYWCHREPPPDDDDQLARIARLDSRRWAKARRNLESLFEIEAGEWRHKKVEEELAKAAKRSHGYSNRGRAGAAARWRDKTAAAPPKREAQPRTEQLSLVPEDPPPESDTVSTAFQLYNDTTKQCRVKYARALTDERRVKIRQRLKDCGGLEGWRMALEMLRTSRHCNGFNDKGWIADLDFVLQKRSFVRLMEGFYNQTDTRGSADGNSVSDAADRERARLRRDRDRNPADD